MKAKHIFGTITVVAIIGGTIYAIKKSRDLKKAEGEEISLKEAQMIVDSRKDEVHEVKDFSSAYPTYFQEKDHNHVTTYKNMVEYAKADVEATRRLMEDLRANHEMTKDDIDNVIFESRVDAGEIAEYNAGFEKPYENEEFEDEEETELEDIEEGDELRYEPNSREARTQFIKMELAEWAPLEDVHQTMVNLFEFPFEPQNDGDWELKTKIIDYRVQFFGFGSRWAKEVSYADIILYYAKQAEFNVGESVRYWVEYFLEFNEIDFTSGSHEIDDMLKRLNSHTYFNEERATFGLFGLTRECMDQAIKIANRNVDRSVTYDIEFNEFLKSCV